MSAQVTLNLSDKFYEQAQHYAQTRHQEIARSLTEFLERTLPTVEAPTPNSNLQTEQFQALDREKEAYIKLHPQLKQSHLGQYVAIYRGELIDQDTDFGTLVERVRSRLPRQIVLITEVGDEAVRTYTRRSPRFLHNGT